VAFQPEVRLLPRPKQARVVLAQNLVSVERTVRLRDPERPLGMQLGRKHVNRSAIVGRTHVRRRARAAVKVHIADRRRRHIRPGVMARVIRVVERHPVPRHRVVVIHKAAKVNLRLSQTHAIRAPAHRTRRGLHNIGKVGHRLREVLHILAGDLRAGRSGVQNRLHRRKARGQRVIRLRFHLHLLRYRGNRHLEAQALRRIRRHLDDVSRLGRKSRSRHLHRVNTGRQPLENESAAGIRRHIAHMARGINGCGGRALDVLARLVHHRTLNGSGSRLRMQIARARHQQQQANK